MSDKDFAEVLRRLKSKKNISKNSISKAPRGTFRRANTKIISGKNDIFDELRKRLRAISASGIKIYCPDLITLDTNNRGNMKNKKTSALTEILSMREYVPVVLEKEVYARLAEWDENNNALEKARPHTWLTSKDGVSPIRGSSSYGEQYVVNSMLDKLEKIVGDLVLVHADPTIGDSTANAGSFIFGNRLSTFFIEFSSVKKSDLTLFDKDVIKKIDEKLIEGEDLLVTGYITYYISAHEIKSEQIKNVTEAIEDCAAETDKLSVSINMITHNANAGYRVRNLPMSHWPELDDNDIKLHYGDNFLEFSTALVKKVKETTKGIVMLHGPPGTGKTYYIRRLTTALTKAGKQVFMIPKGVVDMIQDPGFVDFMINHFSSDNPESRDEKKTGIVFIVEDAESLLVKRNTDSHAAVGVSTLLNLTDGILNDLFNVQIIATFNTAIDNLDEALLRKGRLLAIRELGLLDRNEAKRLADHLHNDSSNVLKEMTLSEVYSLGAAEEETILTQNKPVKKARQTGFM